MFPTTVQNAVLCGIMVSVYGSAQLFTNATFFVKQKHVRKELVVKSGRHLTAYLPWWELPDTGGAESAVWRSARATGKETGSSSGMKLACSPARRCVLFREAGGENS